MSRDVALAVVGAGIPANVQEIRGGILQGESNNRNLRFHENEPRKNAGIMGYMGYMGYTRDIWRSTMGIPSTETWTAMKSRKSMEIPEIYEGKLSHVTRGQTRHRYSWGNCW